jgi:glycosyltransferase involved in cell wall biosynthesis
MEDTAQVAYPRICWFGIWNERYPRNHVLLTGLRKLGYPIVECRVPQDGGLRKHLTLIKKLRALRGSYDLIYVAYPAPSVALWARLFGRGPIVVDAFYSMYDAVVCDRREIGALHPRAWKLGVLDWVSVRVAHLTIFDTREHEKYMKSWWGLSRARCAVVPIGVDDALMRPPARAQGEAEPFRVLFFGSYIPLHGVHHIVDAATILKDEPRVVFRFVGAGQDFKPTQRRIVERRLTNVEVIDKKVPHEEVVRHIGESDVVLGIFGDTQKARRVVPNKVFEALACKKPVITMDTPAIRECYDDSHLRLVSNNGVSIAKAVQELLNNSSKRDAYAQAGYVANEAYFPELNARRLAESLKAVYR